jgi:ubiquitin-conjugating enzyme E2 J2
MASNAAIKRLTREYAAIQQNPPEFIVAHPSESNILEWHYILTGPPNTPYEGGQYWGTLTFPPDYPFNPPAIRMLTASGRFQSNTRLCLSISDFHPKSFNPAWSVSTILIGLMSFMTGEEMTTGSVRASDLERRVLAAKTRWYNSTGNGSSTRKIPSISGGQSASSSSLKTGDGGVRFRSEWPEIDAENWKWMEERRMDPASGMVVKSSSTQSCTPGARALPILNSTPGAVVEGAQVARNAGQGFLRRNIGLVIFFGFMVYAVTSRLMSEGRSIQDL